MLDLPKITMITPSYNQGAYIRETIDSVLDQSYPDLEYWVIDGGSSDHTMEILGSYGDRLRWISETDRGQSHAINKGLQRASGEVLGFINSDDTLAPGALLKVGHFFSQHPETAWLTGICRTIGPEGEEIRRGITAYKKFWLRLRSYRVLCVVNYISQPATFWRQQVVEQVGWFDEQWHYAMDYDYWLRVGKQFKLWYLDEHLANFRVHPTSKAGASASAQFEGAFEIAKAHIESDLILKLHRLHDKLTIAVYKTLSVG